MLKRRYIVDSIVQEYNRKKRYEKKIEMQQFQKKYCLNCKNKKTSKCEIRRNVDGDLMCAFCEI